MIFSGETLGGLVGVKSSEFGFKNCLRKEDRQDASDIHGDSSSVITLGCEEA